METQEKLTVRAVAKLSGVSAHSLRAWERRYGIITPTRTSTGHRAYSFRDVEKVRLLHELIEMGHSIGSLANLSPKALNDLKLKTPHHQISEMVHAVETFDLELLDRKIGQARLNHTVSDFIHSVAAPLLAEVGRRVALNHFDITHEHMLSAILRNHLGSLLSQAQQSYLALPPEKKKHRKYLFTTREGDLHEFGILLAAILCASAGNLVQYIGPNTPFENLSKMAAATKTDYILIGSTRLPETLKVQPLEQFIEKLLKATPKSVSILIGGYCDLNLKKKNFENRVQFLESLRSFEASL